MAQSNRHNRCCSHIPERLWGEVLKGLPEGEARVVRLRFGLEGAPPLTIAQVAKALSLTRERVRQIEVGILNRLQKVRPQNKP